MERQGSAAWSIGQNFATFVDSHIPDFSLPMDPMRSFAAGAEYGVRDDNALLPVDIVRFEMRRSSSLDYVQGESVPVHYCVRFVPEVNFERRNLGRLTSAWEAVVTASGIDFKYYPDGDNEIDSDYEPFARVMGRLALFEAAHQLSFRGQEIHLGAERTMAERSAIDTAFEELLRRNDLI